MKRARRKNHCDDRFAAVATPPLTGEAVIYIHRALENWLHLFEERYVGQIRRYYHDREQHNLAMQRRPATDDDEPF